MQLRPGVEGVWQGEDQVVVIDGQQLLALLLAPLLTDLALALGAVAVAAGVIVGLSVVTVATVQHVAAQGRSATPVNPLTGVVLLRTEAVVLSVVGQVIIHDRLHGGGVSHGGPPGRQSSRRRPLPDSRAPNGHSARCCGCLGDPAAA